MSNNQLTANISDGALAKLQDIRETSKPLVDLRIVPSDVKFIRILPHVEGEVYWTEMTGRICNVSVRGYHHCTAKLRSVVFKEIRHLTEDDAIAAGYRGEDPLAKLIDSLERWLSKKKYWNGHCTKLQLLNLERTDK